MVVFEVSIAILQPQRRLALAAQQAQPLAGLREASRVDRSGPCVLQGYWNGGWRQKPYRRACPVREQGTQPRLSMPPPTTPSPRCRPSRPFRGTARFDPRHPWISSCLTERTYAHPPVTRGTRHRTGALERGVLLGDAAADGDLLEGSICAYIHDLILRVNFAYESSCSVMH
jgi:hypothetical protein